MSSEVETSLAIPFVSVVLIERQAFGAYNAKQCARNQSKSKNGFESLPHRFISWRFLWVRDGEYARSRAIRIAASHMKALMARETFTFFTRDRGAGVPNLIAYSAQRCSSMRMKLSILAS